MHPTSVALATAAEEGSAEGLVDPELRLLQAALRERGIEAPTVVWDDPGQDWAAHDLVVVRSTWDYARRRDEFLAWAEHVDDTSRLLNGPDLLAWTTDKRYLDALAAAGVPVVPSAFLAPGQGPDHPWLGVEHVVKPSVSAGSVDTLRLGPGDTERSRDHVAAVHATGRTALVQPYLEAVDTYGETALLFLDGAFSHAIRKGPLLQPGAGLVEGLFAEEEIEPREPSDAEREVADAALAALPASAEPPLYCRVDLLASDEGPRVLEVELAEPSFFLDHAPGSADRFADAIVAPARLSPRRTPSGRGRPGVSGQPGRQPARPAPRRRARGRPAGRRGPAPSRRRAAARPRAAPAARSRCRPARRPRRRRRRGRA